MEKTNISILLDYLEAMMHLDISLRSLSSGVIATFYYCTLQTPQFTI
ncbi:MAG: hypothetical protein KME40_29725 [Komarekiella atlantica HA4396-MV6]|nr:hypothetical protein [Komarekiella atlantica HA4396-MV6]